MNEIGVSVFQNSFKKKIASIRPAITPAILKKIISINLVGQNKIVQSAKNFYGIMAIISSFVRRMSLNGPGYFLSWPKTFKLTWSSIATLSKSITPKIKMLLITKFNTWDLPWLKTPMTVASCQLLEVE